jgi:hypothetical protein
MLYRHQLNPPQVRRRCRNPRCGAKLKAPTTDRRNAFCSKGCKVAYYNSRCLICENLFDRKTGRRVVCSRSKCRHQLERHPERFALSATPLAGVGHNASRNPIKSGLKIATKSGRPFRTVAGPGVPEINLRITPAEIPTSRANKAFAKYWQKAKRRAARLALIKRKTPPINIVGGYKFPNAPMIDLGPTAATPTPPPKPSIGDDLSIPAFLKRSTAKSEDNSNGT